MSNTMEYLHFIESKQKSIIKSGFAIDDQLLNNKLFEFQKFIVQRALNAGKYAIFADCGLGKTLMQLEWANQVVKHTNQPVLILAPLAVSGQTIKEGQKFNIKVWKWIDNDKAISEDYHSGIPRIWITNYEQLENIDCSIFSGVVLDESSILKNYEGSTKKLILDYFSTTPYKLACTATPSPNDPMELGNHSEFLDVMTRTEMLSMYFIHDGGETAKWRLKGHATKLFYQFVGSWAIMLNNPKDIGFEMHGYDLPKLKLYEKQIATEKRNNGSLFNDTAINATNFNEELRLTKVERLQEACDIVNASKESFIIWIKQNEEGELLKKLIPDAVEVKGSDSPEYKEKMLLGFANNQFRVLITKTKIAQFGLNYQNCRNQIFASLDFSFEGLYQAIRRSYRFGQKKNVNIYLITTDTMQNVIQSINNKQKQFEEMQDQMSQAINANLNNEVFSKLSLDTDSVNNEWYRIERGDSCQLIKTIPDNSVHYSIFSPPFASLYTYSDHVEDMGNSKNYHEFFDHFKFLVKDLFRILKPGRNVSIHCMNLPTTKSHHGFIGIEDFRGDIIRLFQECGFTYHSEVCIWKDPVIAMQRTKAIGLLHKQVVKDSCMSRQGIPDYLVTMKKPGENTEPVAGEFDHFCGDIDTFKSEGRLSIDIWQRYASPVWMDINPSNTLQYMSARHEKDERHICPLQLDVIHRGIQLWSNAGDVVFTPFLGIGSEVYEAVKLNRKGIGFELKESYYDIAKQNIASVVQEKNQISLF
jgi:DNA modification methylase